jgi:hypothetical protein
VLVRGKDAEANTKLFETINDTIKAAGVSHHQNSGQAVSNYSAEESWNPSQGYFKRTIYRRVEEGLLEDIFRCGWSGYCAGSICCCFGY